MKSCFIHRSFALVCCLAVSSGCGSLLTWQLREYYLKKLPTVCVVMPNGERHGCYLADTKFRRRRGLMGQQVLDDSVMLFVFETVSRHSFWMKNVYVPLEVAFLDEQGQVIETIKMAPDFPNRLSPLPEYRSAVAAQFVLEGSSDLFREKGIRQGAVVALPSCLFFR